jgi:hypothetical protein
MRQKRRNLSTRMYSDRSETALASRSKRPQREISPGANQSHRPYETGSISGHDPGISCQATSRPDAFRLDVNEKAGF